MVSELIAALNLPPESVVDRRIPKTLFIQNAAPTAADKRYINDGIEELWWFAALKPATIGVPEYHDEARDYVEIAVVRLSLRANARAVRLVELVHRAVPYPVLLLTEQGEDSGMSAVHKRLSQGEAGKMVLDGEMVAINCKGSHDKSVAEKFLRALALERQPKSTLFTLYQGWMDTLVALIAAGLTGSFSVPGTKEQSAARNAALQECARLNAEIIRLRAAAAKEKQIPKLVDLNMQIKRLSKDLSAAQSKL